MSDPDECLAEARKQTALENFGNHDFREGLAVYCEAVRSEAKLNEIGVMAVHANVVANLANRLRVVDLVTRHTDVANEHIDAPLIVIGLFRAGTTFLSDLLDQDTGNRPLLRWEAGDSVPPPTLANFRSGPRVDAVRASAGMLEQLNPKIAAIHHEEADGPTECISVKSLALEAIANAPTYGAWLRDVDQRSAYQYHRLVLQVLQHGGVRGRWTLKSPHHALALDALTAVYPDARLVLLHRDPVVLCASVCSLISTLSGTFSDIDHRGYIAEHWTAMLATSISRIDAFRAAHPDCPILDVQYRDLMQRPVATVAGIYRSVGDNLTGEAQAAMESYVAGNRKGRFGVHGYDLAEFGLDEGEIAERFASYVARYDVPTESKEPR